MENILLQFLIQDKLNKPGTQWWSFMDIHPRKNLLLFDSLGLEGFKFFVER